MTTDRIISAATKLFAAHGYDGVSIKEICQTADVNIAAIHYHFESKEKLYHYLLSQFASTRLDFARKTLREPHTLDEFKVRLEIFLQETLATFPEQSEIISIIHREMESQYPRGIDTFLKTMRSHAQVLIEFFEQAKKNRILSPDLDPVLTAMGFMGQIIHLMKKPQIIQKLIGVSVSDPAFQARWVSHTVWLFLNGALKK